MNVGKCAMWHPFRLFSYKTILHCRITHSQQTQETENIQAPIICSSFSFLSFASYSRCFTIPGAVSVTLTVAVAIVLWRFSNHMKCCHCHPHWIFNQIPNRSFVECVHKTTWAISQIEYYLYIIFVCILLLFILIFILVHHLFFLFFACSRLLGMSPFRIRFSSPFIFLCSTFFVNLISIHRNGFLQFFFLLFASFCLKKHYVLWDPTPRIDWCFRFVITFCTCFISCFFFVSTSEHTHTLVLLELNTKWWFSFPFTFTNVTYVTSSTPIPIRMRE